MVDRRQPALGGKGQEIGSLRRERGEDETTRASARFLVQLRICGDEILQTFYVHDPELHAERASRWLEFLQILSRCDRLVRKLVTIVLWNTACIGGSDIFCLMREDPTPEVGFGLSTLVARRFDRVSRQRDGRAGCS